MKSKSKSGLILLMLFGLFFMVTCNIPNNNEEAAPDNFDVPALVNVTISSVNSYSAVLSCNVLNPGNSPVTVRGVCYGQWEIPFAYDTNNVTIESGSGLGPFSVNITGLKEGATYYVRAYAENHSGVGYSNGPTFVANFTIGQNYEGGILFYIDKTTAHGLVAAPTDLGLAPWGCVGTVTGAYQVTTGSGQQNTTDIINNGCSTSGIAAVLCNNLILGGNSGWYLPSLLELGLLYAQKDTVGGFTQGYYWTSSEYDANNAYYQSFSNGGQTYVNKSTQANVRAIRSF